MGNFTRETEKRSLEWFLAQRHREPEAKQAEEITGRFLEHRGTGSIFSTEAQRVEGERRTQWRFCRT